MATEEEERDDNNTPPNLESIDHQTGSAAGGDRSRLLVELCAERDALLRLGQGSQGDDDDEDGNETPRHSLRLLEDEIFRIQGFELEGGDRTTSASPSSAEVAADSSSSAASASSLVGLKYVDVYRERPIRLTVRVLVPVNEHPKFNFVGKLLGPKGNSMKRLQEETMTKMAVLGRGSMRDKQKEEWLRASPDPKYAHLKEDLHVEVTAFAPPAEAHARVAYALAEVRKYLIPDSNDEIRQKQMREMEIMSTSIHPSESGNNGGGESASSSDPSLASAIAIMQQRAVAAAAVTAAAPYYPYPAAAAHMTGASPLSHQQAVIPSQANGAQAMASLQQVTLLRAASLPMVLNVNPAAAYQHHLQYDMVDADTRKTDLIGDGGGKMASEFSLSSQRHITPTPYTKP